MPTPCRGKTWGRARLTVTYEDGLVQTIHYFVIKPESDGRRRSRAVPDHAAVVRSIRNDPFKRAPSVMSYDREENHIVMQDSRVWIAGLAMKAAPGPG